VAAILRGKVVHPQVEMTVTPGSRQILDAIARTDVYRDLVAAGTRVLEAVCGPCIGIGQAPASGVVSVRTFNRNFPGRSGTSGDQVYLCSPSVAAATALRAEITDPRGEGVPPEITPGVYHPEVVDGHIVDPPPRAESEQVEVVRSKNILPPPEPHPLPSRVEGRILIVLEDDVSTGDMAPDGALGISLWSNIPACATYMFRRFDPEFHGRAVSWSGGIIVAGHNYGQGSSREQAALSALQLGVRAVVAKSFARIHRQNLIAQGIVPLVFARAEDHGSARVGDTWTIEAVREGIAAGSESFLCRAGRETSFELKTNLLARERQTILAGGTLRYLRT
jgi:aconitate hydratase